jgi:hypothetical protein
MIRMRLGGSNDPLEPFPQKPRGMHWRTYRRARVTRRWEPYAGMVYFQMLLEGLYETGELK